MEFDRRVLVNQGMEKHARTVGQRRPLCGSSAYSPYWWLFYGPTTSCSLDQVSGFDFLELRNSAQYQQASTTEAVITSCGLAAYTLQNMAVVGMMSVRPRSRHIGLRVQVDLFFPVYNISHVCLPFGYQEPTFRLPDRPDAMKGLLRPLDC